LKILQENIENTLENIGTGNYFLTMSPVGQDINTITDKWNCIKLKSFYTTKEIILRIKREWEKSFASYISDKGFISRIYKELKHPKDD
jgi:hypothetical protein